MSNSDELEERLLGIMSRTQVAPIKMLSRREGRQGDIALLGLDTNILKILRRQPGVTQNLSDLAHQGQVILIIPGQSLTEYWNNYKTFTKEELSSALSSTKKLEQLTDMPDVQAKATEISKLLTRALDESLDEDEIYRRSIQTIETLLKNGHLFHVDRPRFLSTGRARLESKTPPGFADEKAKTSALGDFYMWADFLYGAATKLPEASNDAARVILVTEDSKPDWRAGGVIHPILRAESRAYLGYEVELWKFDDLDRWLKSTLE